MSVADPRPASDSPHTTVAMADKRVAALAPQARSQACTYAQGLLLLCAAAWYLPYTAGIDFTGFVADDALYLLMAEVFTPGHDTDTVQNYVRGISHLPPLYPALLGAFGADGYHLGIAHLVQNLCLLSALLLLARLTSRMLDDRLAGLLMFMLWALAPATLLLDTEIWSEFLYLALATASLLSALHAPRRASAWLAAALLGGLAAVTRSVGICLVAGVLASVLFKAPRRLPACAALAVAPLLLAALADFGGGVVYLDVFEHRLGSGSAIPAVVQANVAALAEAGVRVFTRVEGPAVPIIGGALGVLAVLGLVQRLRAAQPDGFYAVSHLALALVWPFPDIALRLVYVILPVLVLHACLGAGLLAGRLAGDTRVWATRAPLLLLGALVAWSGGALITTYLGEPLPPQLAGFRASAYWLDNRDRAAARADVELKHAMRELMRRVGSLVPADACVYALQPASLMLYARRPSWPAERGRTRPPQPRCAYQLLLSDGHLRESVASLWPGYEVVHVARLERGVAGILVHYPRP